MENVSTFLKAPEFSQLLSWTRPGRLLADWQLDARVLVAADYGSPQLRRRTVVIGHRRDTAAPEYPQATHHAGSDLTVADAFKGVTPNVTDIYLPQRTTELDNRVFAGAFRSDELHLTRDYQDLSRQRFATSPLGGTDSICRSTSRRAVGAITTPVPAM